LQVTSTRSKLKFSHKILKKFSLSKNQEETTTIGGVSEGNNGTSVARERRNEVTGKYWERSGRSEAGCGGWGRNELEQSEKKKNIEIKKSVIYW
jgi:hypothetical protein